MFFAFLPTFLRSFFFSSRNYSRLRPFMATGMALLLSAPAVRGDEAAMVSHFEAKLDLGTVCRFGVLSWTDDAHTEGTISVSAGTAEVPTFGGFWGRRYTDPVPVHNGEQIPAPAGQFLKLTLTVRGLGEHTAPPPIALSIEYQPLAAPRDAWQRLDVSPSLLQRKEEPIDHIALSNEVVTPHIA